jgi:cytosine permease
MADTVGMDDYSLARVPAEARYPWWSIAVQRFGQVSALRAGRKRGTVGPGGLPVFVVGGR